MVDGTDWHLNATDQSATATASWRSHPAWAARLPHSYGRKLDFHAFVHAFGEHQTDYDGLRLSKLDELTKATKVEVTWEDSPILKSRPLFVAPLPGATSENHGIDESLPTWQNDQGEEMPPIVDTFQLPANVSLWSAEIVRIMRWYNRTLPASNKDEPECQGGHFPYHWWCNPAFFEVEFGRAPFASGWVDESSTAQWLAAYDAVHDAVRAEFPFPGNDLHIAAPSLYFDATKLKNRTTPASIGRLRKFIAHTNAKDRLPSIITAEVGARTSVDAAEAVAKIRAELPVAPSGASTTAGPRFWVSSLKHLGNPVATTFLADRNATAVRRSEAARAAFVAAAHIRFAVDVDTLGVGAIARRAGANDTLMPSELRWFGVSSTVDGKYRLPVWAQMIFRGGIMGTRPYVQHAALCSLQGKPTWGCDSATTAAAIARRKYVLAMPAPTAQVAADAKGAPLPPVILTSLAVTERCISLENKAQHCAKTTDQLLRPGEPLTTEGGSAKTLIRLAVAAEADDATSPIQLVHATMKLSGLGQAKQAWWRSSTLKDTPIAWLTVPFSDVHKVAIKGGAATVQVAMGAPGAAYVELWY